VLNLFVGLAVSLLNVFCDVICDLFSFSVTLASCAHYYNVSSPEGFSFIETIISCLHI